MSTKRQTDRLERAVQREAARVKARDTMEEGRLRAVVDRRKRKLDQAQRNLASFLEKKAEHEKPKKSSRKKKAADADPQA